MISLQRFADNLTVITGREWQVIENLKGLQNRALEETVQFFGMKPTVATCTGKTYAPGCGFLSEICKGGYDTEAKMISNSPMSNYNAFDDIVVDQETIELHEFMRENTEFSQFPRLDFVHGIIKWLEHDTLVSKGTVTILPHHIKPQMYQLAEEIATHLRNEYSDTNSNPLPLDYERWDTPFTEEELAKAAKLHQYWIEIHDSYALWKEFKKFTDPNDR